MNIKLFNFAARLRAIISSEERALRVPNRKNGDLCSSVLPNFDSLALELFALQFQHNDAYRKFCRGRGLTPRVVEHWTQIPAVPTSAFKELELTSLVPAERTAVFHSSGTSEQKPSRHFHCVESLAVYEASLWQWFRFHFGESGELVFLTPRPGVVPRSSLVHMFEAVRQKFGLPESAFTGKVSADGSWAVDFDDTVQKLKSARGAGTPLTLLGTAFSFVHLLDYLADKNLRIQLPEGSRVMETGGYKNRSRVLPKTELCALINEWLGVPPKKIICEYGMSELSSQAYSVPGAGCRVTNRNAATHHAALVAHHFHFPPWTRVQIVSPENGREVREGETGLIRILDLANVFSVAAIQTEDLGVRHGDGFELIGRAHLAEPRGCSLMAA